MSKNINTIFIFVLFALKYSLLQQFFRFFFILCVECTIKKTYVVIINYKILIKLNKHNFLFFIAIMCNHF